MIDEALEDAYVPSRTLRPSASFPDAAPGDWRPYLEAYRIRTAEARRRFARRLGLVHGPGPGARLDLYGPDGAGDPLVVFLHGGYWQELGLEEAAVDVERSVAAGCGWASVGYPLAPQATLAAITAACVAAIDLLGRDRRPLRLVGHSAGAHLALEVALARPGLLESLTLVSGVYDLRPLVRTSVNGALGLDEASAAAASPLLRLPGGPLAMPVTVAVAEYDPVGFDEQALRLGDALRTDVVVVAGTNHFDVVLDLGPLAVYDR